MRTARELLFSEAMTDPRVAKLVALYGWRISNLDARRAGVPEAALFDAERRGEARGVHTSFHVRTYLVFA